MFTLCYLCVSKRKKECGGRKLFFGLNNFFNFLVSHQAKNNKNNNTDNNNDKVMEHNIFSNLLIIH